MIRKFAFEKLSLDGAYKIVSFCAEDNRGKFVKDYSSEAFAAAGIVHELKEVFYTYSTKGVIRALHFQKVKEQAKLVRCVKGHVWDVIVDLRKDSPSYRQWQAFDLTEKNGVELLVPEHFAHGYLVLEDSIVAYKCAEKFYGEYDTGIRWNDPDLAVVWPLEKIGGADKVILSDKDLSLPSFVEWERNA